MPNLFASTLGRKHAHDAPKKKHKDPCLASLPRNCHVWEVKHVQEWLKSIEMNKYCELFEHIEGKDLSEQKDVEAWLYDYGIDSNLERKKIAHSWDAYLHRWRFTATPVNPFAVNKGPSKFNLKWKKAGAATVMSNRIQHLLTAKQYNSYSTKPLKTVHAGDYDNYLDLLDLDLNVSVRGRTKVKMEKMDFKDLVERKKHIKHNYSGTNKHISRKSRQRSQARAGKAPGHEARSFGESSLPSLQQGQSTNSLIFGDWRHRGNYIDVDHWRSELLGNRRLYMPRGTVSPPRQRPATGAVARRSNRHPSNASSRPSTSSLALPVI